MSNITGLNSATSVNPVQPNLSTNKAAKAQTPAPQGDTVEFSSEARLASMLSSVPPIRTELVSRVKAEIQAGTYDTPAKFEVALSKLMDEMG